MKKLNALRENGTLSEEEFQQAKNDVLGGDPPANWNYRNEKENATTNDSTWTMMIHLTQFCGYLVPLAGLIVPIVLWQTKKDDSEAIDLHGRIVANWIISEIIMFMIAGVLVVVFIGIPLLAIIAILGIVFPIIGGIKASNGEVWVYPLSFKFFSLDGLEDNRDVY